MFNSEAFNPLPFGSITMPVATEISTLWIVVLFNMIFADILGFMYPGFVGEVLTGVVGGITITPAFLVVAAVFIEIAIVMIYLTRTLPAHISRIANLIAAGVTIAFVIGGGSLTLHYIFFATIEVGVLIYIAYLAWHWKYDGLG